MKKTISQWIDTVLNTDIPENVVAFCFNLYEEGGKAWSIELIGSDRFDLMDEDWACSEITDFNSRQNLYMWEKDCTWEEALESAIKELTAYLQTGKHGEVLKSRTAVGAGFVDGDLHILYHRSNEVTSDV